MPWPMSGARTFPVWLAARAHLTRARAQRVTRLARALRDELPLTAAAVVQGGQGRVTVEQASAAPNARSRASCAAPSSPGTNIASSRGAPPRRAGAKVTIPSTGFVIRGIPTPDPDCCCAGTTATTCTTTGSRSPGNPAAPGNSPTATAPPCTAEPTPARTVRQLHQAQAQAQAQARAQAQGRVADGSGQPRAAVTAGLGGISTAISRPSRAPVDSSRSSPLQNRPGS